MASRLDLAFSGDKRGRSKALFFAVLHGRSITDSDPVIFHMTQRTGLTDKVPLRQPQKMSRPARISFPARAAFVPLLDWLPERVARDFCNLENSDAMGDDSSFFAVTQQPFEECYVANLLAHCHPPQWDPRLASGAFAVGKDEGCDRFTGDTPVEQPWKALDVHTCPTARDSVA